MKRKVVIVDDHPLFSKSMADLLAQTGLEVCALAQNGADALAAVDLHNPELLVVDLSLPDMSGFRVIETAVTRHPGIRCIVVSMHEQAQYAKRALRAGAKGYLVKADDEAVVKACVDAIFNGECFISQQIENSNLIPLDESPKTSLDYADTALLTASEIKVLRLIQQGNTSKDIAKRLKISYRTVQNHRAHMCEKLGLSGTNALLRVAIAEKYRKHDHVNERTKVPKKRAKSVSSRH